MLQQWQAAHARHLQHVNALASQADETRRRLEQVCLPQGSAAAAAVAAAALEQGSQQGGGVYSEVLVVSKCGLAGPDQALPSKDMIV